MPDLRDALAQSVAYFDWLTDLLGTVDFEEPGGKVALEMLLEARRVRAKCLDALERPTEAADVLDTMANPHPRMWAEARDLFANRNSNPVAKARWDTALQMMCAATGYEPIYFLDKIADEIG